MGTDKQLKLLLFTVDPGGQTRMPMAAVLAYGWLNDPCMIMFPGTVPRGRRSAAAHAMRRCRVRSGGIRPLSFAVPEFVP